jgi:hypothetical protein
MPPADPIGRDVLNSQLAERRPQVVLEDRCVVAQRRRLAREVIAQPLEVAVGGLVETKSPA